MFIPHINKMEDLQSIQQFINEFNFGILFSPCLQATHLPFVLQVHNDQMTLRSHMARANPHYKTLDGQEVLVVFNGPHAYISPTWYVGKPSVPTWNYAAVHCRGIVKVLNAEDTESSIEQVLLKHESHLIEDKLQMPDDYQARLRKATVGIQIHISELQGKEKLGQERSQADQFGVFSALSSSQRPDEQHLAQYMQKRQLGTGN